MVYGENVINLPVEENAEAGVRNDGCFFAIPDREAGICSKVSSSTRNTSAISFSPVMMKDSISSSSSSKSTRRYFFVSSRVASHMDNVPHATLTRKTLEEKLKEKGIRERVRIPEDGESYWI